MSKYQIIKGSEFYPNFNDIDMNEPVNIYFYQLALFSDNKTTTTNPKICKEGGIYNVRAYKFKGIGSTGAGGSSGYSNCLYKYDIIDINDYKITKNKLDKFVEKLEKKKNSNDTVSNCNESVNNIKYKNISNNEEKKSLNILYKYKYYPVYNFDNTPPPHGYEINECTSELLN